MRSDLKNNMALSECYWILHKLIGDTELPIVDLVSPEFEFFTIEPNGIVSPNFSLSVKTLSTTPYNCKAKKLLVSNTNIKSYVILDYDGVKEVKQPASIVAVASKPIIRSF